MVKIHELVPKIKIADIQPGTALHIADSEFDIKVAAKTDGVVITIESVAQEPGWAVMKIVDPNPDLLLIDVVLSAIIVINSIIRHGLEDPKA
jgi:hypothetical protein